MRKFEIKSFLAAILLLCSCPGLYSQWIQQNSGTTVNLYSISHADTNTLYSFGSGNVLLRSTNSGINWVQVNTGLTYPGLRLCYFINQNTGWIGGRAIYKTTNGGSNWVLQRTYDSAYSNNCFCFVNSQTGWCTYTKNVWPPEGGVLNTTNGGANWYVQRNSLDYYQCVQFLNNVTGFISGYAYFYKTTNGGVNWSYSSYSGGVRVYFVSPDTGWITSTAIYKTTNGGLNWVYQSGASTQCTALQFLSNSTGYAAAGPKIYKTTNSGLIWTENYNSPSGYIWDFYFADHSTGWAAGDNGSIFRTTNGGITNVSVQETEIPKDIYLYQNFPNPFNPSTQITFRTAKSGPFSLDVFDARGLSVKTLVSRYFLPGTYTVVFNSSGLPGGIYFYRVKSGNDQVTRKMILLK